MKKILSLLIAMLFFITSYQIVLSQEQKAVHPIDKWLQEYENKEENQDTQGMAMGYVEATKKWDAELNKVYKQLMNKLPAKAKESLKTAQKSWLKFRDEEFKFIQVAYDLDGTIWSISKASSSMTLVKERTLSLQSYLDSLNGDSF